MKKKLLLTPVLIAATIAPPKLVRESSASKTSVPSSHLLALEPLVRDNNIPVEEIPNLVSEERPVKAGLLYDAKRKKIVWEKEMNTSFPIASLTKMMVALITAEDIKSGRLNWDMYIPVTKEASRMTGSKVFLRKGELFTIRELMKSAMIASGNDACYLLAQFNGGTEKAFVERMNKRAAKLGMKQTHYSNATGLPDKAHHDNQASPYDLLLLANELLKYPEVVDIAGRAEEYIRHGNKNFAYRNHNKLAIEYQNEIDGLKTGFTNKAGFCIVATCNRGSRRLVSIALGARKSVTRNNFVEGVVNNYYGTLGMGKLGEELPKSND